MGPEVGLGPGDDAALIGSDAWTVDALLEGVHFDARLSPEDIGYKAIAVSASDLGAMGARPAWALLTLALPRPVDPVWVDAFARGVGAACRAFGVALVGGDTTRSPGPVCVTVTLGGPCPRPMLRSGGRPGDVLWVTGTPGLAALGYSLADPPPAALAALRHPEPPVAFALAVAAAGLATAAMDLSDGLAADLPRLCTASGVGAVVDEAAMPAHPDLIDARAARLAGGDDYALLLAAPHASRDALLALAEAHGIRLTAIGRLTDAPEVCLARGTWPDSPFSHFGAAR